MMRRWPNLLLIAILTLGLWLGSLPVQAAAALPRELQQLEQQVEQLQSLVDAEDWLESGHICRTGGTLAGREPTEGWGSAFI